MLAWGASLIVLVMERDLGSSLLFFAVFVTMVWIATERSAFLLIGLLLFGGGAYFSYTTFDHVHARVQAWTNPWADPKGKGFQIIEGYFAMAEGGLTGTGLGLGRPYKIPKVETDFIFAAIGEELGLAGSTAILISLCADRWVGPADGDPSAHSVREAVRRRAFRDDRHPGVHHHRRRYPRRSPHRYHIPFVSYGGSSLLANYVLARSAGAYLRRSATVNRARPCAGAAAAPEPWRYGRGRRMNRQIRRTRHRASSALHAACSRSSIASRSSARSDCRTTSTTRATSLRDFGKAARRDHHRRRVAFGAISVPIEESNRTYLRAVSAS